MTNEPTDADQRSKAIKKLMAIWKRNLDVRQKALILLELHPTPKIRKIKGYRIP